jgi:hypothetical protein
MFYFIVLSRVVFAVVDFTDFVSQSLGLWRGGTNLVPLGREFGHNDIQALLADFVFKDGLCLLCHGKAVPELPAGDILLLFKFHQKAMSDRDTKVRVQCENGVHRLNDARDTVHRVKRWWPSRWPCPVGQVPSRDACGCSSWQSLPPCTRVQPS